MQLSLRMLNDAGVGVGGWRFLKMWECGEDDANTPLEGAPNVPWASQVVLGVELS